MRKNLTFIYTNYTAIINGQIPIKKSNQRTGELSQRMRELFKYESF
jgi:hypothetical protein